MVTQKTSREIVEEFGDLANIHDCDLTKKGIKDKYSVWLCASDIKKEIHFCKIMYENNKFNVDEILIYLLNLCKSQEQNDSKTMGVRSVSCERNTGEDKDLNASTTSKKESSPVHSVVASNHSEVSLRETNPKKKCTCKGLSLYIEGSNICGRCGGVL